MGCLLNMWWLYSCLEVDDEDHTQVCFGCHVNVCVVDYGLTGVVGVFVCVCQ